MHLCLHPGWKQPFDFSNLIFFSPVVIFLAFVAGNQVVLVFQLEDFKIRFDRFMDN